MGSAILQALAQAYFKKHRRRLGITDERRADEQAQLQAAQAGDASMLRKAQLQRVLQELELAPEREESQAALRAAQAERAAMVPTKAAPAAGSVEHFMAATPEEQAAVV